MAAPSATSGGGLWITCNHLMPGVGIEDNPNDAEAYLTALTGKMTCRRPIVASFAKNGGADAAVDHGEQPCPVHLDGANTPTTTSHIPGGAAGREVDRSVALRRA